MLPTKGFSEVSQDSLDYFLIDVNLLNNSDDSLYFLTYNNTPIGNIILDSKQFKICLNSFLNNAPIGIELKPGKEFSIPLILETHRRNANANIKIGWALLTPKIVGKMDNYFNLIEEARTKYKNVIWSDPLYLNELGGKPIELR
jgi:hypothetical protein